MQSPGF